MEFSYSLLLRTVFLGLILDSGLGVGAAACAAEDDKPPQVVSEVVVSSNNESSDPAPQGKIEGPIPLKSLIYPGTERNYWIYIPAQYQADKPACCMIVQDGLQRAREWRLPEVMDELIHRGEIPVVVGIFVEPGVVPTTKPGGQPRINRSVEYDSLGDSYARFLIEELLPDAGSRVNLSSDPNHRLLAGASSGGICAFNAAWERPNAFRRVLSTIGTFVGLRGGNELPVLVRKMEHKPIRVFLEDGSNDLNIYAGDWWIANQSMLSALRWAGYDVQHSWAEGAGHNSSHAAQIMPDALRWLWRDFPEPIANLPKAQPQRRVDILVPENSWQQISSGHESVDAVTCNSSGVLFFSDSRAGRIFRMGDDNKTRVFKEFPSRVSSMRFGPDERLYVVKENKQIVRISGDGTEEVVVNDQRCHRLATLPEGFYFSDDLKNKIYWSTYGGQVREAASMTDQVAAMIPTPDQAFIFVAPQGQQTILNFMISEDFTLNHRQRYAHLHMPYLETSSGVTAMLVDDQGRLYVASTLGVQVLDQLGRVHLILAKPTRSPITGMVIGGPLRDTLFVSDGQSVHARKIKAKGVDSFAAPITPPKPQL